MLRLLPQRLRNKLAESHRRAATGTFALIAGGMVLGSILGFGQSIEAQDAPRAGAQAQPAARAQSGATAPLQLPEVDLKIGGETGDGASLIQLMLLMTLLSLAPSIIIMVTPFTRIIIVLSLLRNALGTQQSPPNTVLVGLALFLSLFVMMPVITDINTNALQPYSAKQISYQDALARAQEPVREFMLAQTRQKDLALFVQLAKLDVDKVTVDEVPIHVVIPAFMISELKSAFQIGFVIYLPFLVVDMVVSSILMSMGMLMLPPVLISLPFKLLMFVLSDGWNLIFGSLVRSFKMS